jgi:hypothetical protein
MALKLCSITVDIYFELSSSLHNVKYLALSWYNKINESIEITTCSAISLQLLEIELVEDVGQW